MKPASSRRSWLMLIACIGAAFVAGAIGSAATFENVRTWYPALAKPSWNPPNWIFGPVWATLYVLMGIAAWRVWRTGFIARPHVMGYFVHLVPNTLWSVFFFGLKQPAWALADILMLWVLLVWLLVGFWRADRLAGVLWLPYMLWVTFATALNSAIVWLN
jgi:benzodiazapine receptor